jgi:hypothetical protein
MDHVYATPCIARCLVLMEFCVYMALAGDSPDEKQPVTRSDQCAARLGTVLARYT